MIHSLPLPKIPVLLLGVLTGAFTVSCGSYQSASYYDNDGIYSDGQREVTVERRPQARQYEQRTEGNVYGDYFGQKADEYDEILESEVFTDIDEYSSDSPQDSLPLGPESRYFDEGNDYAGYGGWGDNSSSITVNVYDNWGWGGYGYGLGYPWMYGGYGWGFYSPWRYRWNNPWWGYGYAGYYGWGAWGGWGGWGYYHPHHYYNPYYYPYYYRNGYYNNYGYAYNRSRRGYYDRSIAANGLRGRSNTQAGRSSDRYRSNSGRSNINRNGTQTRSDSRYRSNTTTRRSVGVDGLERNRNYRTSRSTRVTPRYNSGSRSTQRYGTSSPRRSTYNNRATTPSRTGINRGSSGSSRSSGYRSPSSTPRSSGYRSSGSSSRSSGYRSPSRSSSSRSSGYRSSGSSSRSSGYRSSGSSSRSSGAVRSSGSSSSRSSGGRSSGGRSSSRGGRNH